MQYLNARRTLAKLLDWGVVPVINENDTTATDEISFGDNDILAAQVAILLPADLLVVLSDVDALYTSDPREDPARELVAEVRDLAELRDYEIGMSSSHLGSGGMRSKVLCAEMATSAGIPVVICNGTEPGTLLRAVARRAGRDALPSAGAGAQSSFKLWLRYAKASSGARARRPRARSARCASRGRACCRSAWWRWRASSRPATRSTWSPPATAERHDRQGHLATTRPRSCGG